MTAVTDVIKNKMMLSVVFLPFLLFAGLLPTTVESLQVGTGIADATGEVAQVNFMGYAMYVS